MAFKPGCSPLRKMDPGFLAALGPGMTKMRCPGSRAPSPESRVHRLRHKPINQVFDDNRTKVSIE